MRSQLSHSTPISIGGRTKLTVSADYIVGLTDGEGCFYVNIWKSPAYKAGFGVQIHFHIKMQDRDRLLLEKVRNTMQCGAVYFQKENRRNHAQCYRYTANSQKDIFERIIPFFKQHHLQSPSKQESFRLFCSIAELVQKKEHLTSEGIEKIRILKSQMNRKTVGLA
jgi:hypothetical protein